MLTYLKKYSRTKLKKIFIFFYEKEWISIRIAIEGKFLFYVFFRYRLNKFVSIFLTCRLSSDSLQKRPQNIHKNCVAIHLAHWSTIRYVPTLSLFLWLAFQCLKFRTGFKKTKTTLKIFIRFLLFTTLGQHKENSHKIFRNNLNQSLFPGLQDFLDYRISRMTSIFMCNFSIYRSLEIFIQSKVK